MNSFRVIDTRFRILKGGKIGLSLSISLVGSALVFGSVNSYAVDYFTDVQSTISDSETYPSGGTNPITVQKALNSGSINSTRTETDTNPVVFKPTSWANSSYTDPTFSPAETSYFPARYNLGKQDFSSLELNLTFNTGATSGSISKNSTTFYSANITPPGYIADVSDIPKQTLTSVVSNNYKANLIFQGSNTVSGSTNIEDGNIEIKGNVNFQGTVTAGSIDVDTTDTAIFGSNVSLASGSGTLNFSQNGNIILNSNFSGNITTTTTGDGNITTIGNNTINGNIGSSSSSLNSLNIGDLTNISNTTINGDVFANSTVLNNTITNSSTLILSNDKNITSTITTSHDNKGILTLSGGTQTVTGQIGTNALKLAEINAGYGITTFTNNVYATYLDVEGTGTVNLNGSFTGTAIRYNADGTVNLADNQNINSNVITATNNTGTLNLNGTSTVSGTVGTDTHRLKEINAGNGNSTFTGDVFATNLDVEGTGTVNLNGDYTGTAIRYNADGTVILANGSDVNSAITTATNNTGTLTLNGSSTVSGNVGASGASLKEINAGVTGSNSTFTGDVFATTTNVGAGEIKFESNLTGNIDAITSNQGTITFVGDSSGKAQLITGNIGSLGDSINVLNIGESGSLTNYSTTTINGDVFANSTVLNNTITNSSTLILSNDKNITSTITTSHDNKGILTLSGGTQTVTGQIGTNALKLAEINAGYGITTFTNNVYATYLDVEGTGTVNLNGSFTGTAIRYNADGTVNLADNQNINSNVITATNNTGTLNLNGTSTVSGTVGTDTHRLKEINAGNGNSTFTGDVFATNLDVEGTGTVNLNGDYTGTAIRYNADGTVILANGSDVNSAITTATNNTGTLTLNGSSTVSGNVGASGASLKEINAGVTGSNSTFTGDVFATTTNVGAGEIKFESNLTGNIDAITSNQGTITFVGDSSGKAQLITGNIGSLGDSINVLNIGESGSLTNYSTTTINGDVFANSTVLNNTITNSSTLILSNDKNITSTITTSHDNKGILTLSGGTQTVTGQIGTNALKLAEINAGYGITTFTNNVYATYLDVEGTGTVNLNGSFTGTAIRYNADGTVNLADNQNINSNVITATNNTGTLNLNGTSTVSGTVGTDTHRLKEINAGNGSDSTFNSDVFATNLDVEGTGRVNLNGDYKGTSIRYNADGTVVLADGSDVNSSIINNSGVDSTGTLTLNGSSTVSGNVGADGASLKEINAGATGSDSTFSSDVFATTTNITSGVVNFNTISGTTTTNIVFSGNGTANLNQGLTGNIYFAGNDANINVSDGKGILGSVETLANNTGILNFKGDGVINGIIGSADFAIKELNVNSENEQDKDGNGTVITQGLLAHREIFAEIINLRNNATLTLANNANITKTSTGLVISTDSANSGNVVFLGSSTVTGEVGTNSNNLESITTGANNHTVTFNDMVYASIINYSDDGKVVLNGKNNLDANKEGFIGTIDFGIFIDPITGEEIKQAGKLEIGDDVNLTIGTAGTQFVNANNATLTFNGTSNVLGNIGSENGVNDTFKTINTGALNETVKFEDNIYVMDSLNLSSNGKVQIVDENYVKRNSNSATTGAIITTSTDGFGDLEYLGTTILYDDIGTSSKKLNNVTFASTGDASNIYNQDIDKNVYALNTTIGNNSNKTTLNIKEDITFGGNLNLRKDSVLNVSDYNVTVANNLNIASNSTLNFKVYTTDKSAGQAVENGNSGKITAQSLTMANDAKIHIDYDGTWEGAGKYNLIKASSITTDYYGTEKNGLVSDNSIIDSIVTSDGTNLTLFADRTSGDSFNPEDLYIKKSEIGKDYSNGASQSLAGYANEKNREGALADIIREMEYFDGGTNLSESKKQEMIKMQRLLTPTANNSNIQSTITATNLSASTIKGRLSDIRVTQENNFTPNTYDYLGLSSGDYYTFDTSFWLKAMASKATQDRIKEYDGFDTSTYGFVGGMDKITNDGTIFGVALSYSTTKTKQDGLRTDDSDTTSVQATLYSSQEIGDAYVDGYLSYGKHKTDATRTANSGKLNSSVNSDQISAKVETGYKIPLNDGISLTPFASLEYSLLNQKGYTEKGSTYQNDALKVDSIKLNRGTAELGAKLVTNIEFDDTLIIPQFSASVYNSFGDNKPDVKAQFVGGGNKFVTPVSDMNDTMFNLGLGVETKISDSTSLIFDVDYDRSKDGKFEAYSGSVTFGVSF